MHISPSARVSGTGFGAVLLSLIGTTSVWAEAESAAGIVWDYPNTFLSYFVDVTNDATEGFESATVTGQDIVTGYEDSLYREWSRANAFGQLGATAGMGVATYGGVTSVDGTERVRIGGEIGGSLFIFAHSGCDATQCYPAGGAYGATQAQVFIPFYLETDHHFWAQAEVQPALATHCRFYRADLADPIYYLNPTLDEEEDVEGDGVAQASGILPGGAAYALDCMIDAEAYGPMASGGHTAFTSWSARNFWEVQLWPAPPVAIRFRFSSAGVLEWVPLPGEQAWNVYRGDLAVLRAGGAYTQPARSNPIASRSCGLTQSQAVDDFQPLPGEAVFWLITGVTDGVEGSLGTSSQGTVRPNTHPCVM